MGGLTLPGGDLTLILPALLRHGFLMLRIGAFVAASPVFQAKFLPVQVRVMAAAVLTLPVSATVTPPDPASLSTLTAVPMILTEIGLGLACGLALTVVFAAAAMAGERIATVAGLGFAGQFDPMAAAQNTLVGELLNLVLVVVFIGSGGFAEALRLMVDSYRLIPPGGALDLAGLAGAGRVVGHDMFALAARLMAPVVGALTLVNVAAGVLTRAAPQINIFSFGFPLTMGAMIVLLAVLAPDMQADMLGTIAAALSDLRALLAGAAHG